MTRKYASGTSVPVARSQAEIRSLLAKHGADGYRQTEFRHAVTIEAGLAGFVLRFRIDMADADEREERRRWRSLLMAIKAKLVIAQEGIETFQDVFLANIVTHDGKTVGDVVGRQLASGTQRLLIADGAEQHG